MIYDLHTLYISYTHSLPIFSYCRGSLPMNIPKMATPPRPASALARGVNITEYNNNRVNPDPIIIEDSDLLLEEYLSPRKLVSSPLSKKDYFVHDSTCYNAIKV